MITRALCSVITSDYLGAALALNDSVSRFMSLDYFVFVACSSAEGGGLERMCPENVHLLFNDQFCAKGGVGAELYDTYWDQPGRDSFRWAMKPVLMTYVLGLAESVMCVDVDMFFAGSSSSFFDELKTCNILLSPHWRTPDPVVDPANFEKMFSEGYFNGGLVGASRGGLAALDWWANACLYSCDKIRSLGHYVDQRYLDILALEFEGVRVLAHKGYNVAEWNRRACPRSVGNEGQVVVDGKWPIVCIHFASLEVLFSKREDELLKPYFAEYITGLSRHAPALAEKMRALAKQDDCACP